MISLSSFFATPPLARVGMTETQVKEAGIKALIGTRPMSRVSRAVEKGETQGFMKVLVEMLTQMRSIARGKFTFVKIL